MIDTVNSAGLYGRAPSAGSRTGMGQADFMSLLLTQLRHQDPMNPLQPHEFAAQLANFSSVEQLSLLNEGMLEQLQSLDLNAVLGKTSFSASLIGRTVLAEGNRLHVPEDGAITLPVNLGEAGGEVTVILRDENGKEVARRDLGTQSGGRQDLSLPDDLPAGDWTVQVQVKGADGATTNARTYVSGTVDRVLFEQGQIFLSIGGSKVPLEQLLEIAPAALAASDTPDDSTPAGHRPAA
jgi:flagellar basal-body rod modification protein FlgD